LVIIAEESQLCIRGQRDDLGPFESRFEVPSGYSQASATASFANGILRIDLPPNKDLPRSKPMMIYCNECAKLFDIVVTSKGSKNYRCPACGKVQVFDLDAFVKKAVEQSKKMAGKKVGRR
jgi:ribosomal protein S27E